MLRLSQPISLIPLLAGLLFMHALDAQPLFYKVYGWETPPQGWVEPSYWTTYIARSDLDYTSFGTDRSREGLFAHSLETEYGVTDRFALGLYGDFEDPDDGGLRYTRVRGVARYQFFDRYQRFFDTALYAEYILPRASYGPPEEMEVRGIFEKDIEDFRLRINPILSKAVSGAEVEDGVEFSFAGGFYWRRFYYVQPGLEYYNAVGQLSTLPPLDQESHSLFATVDLRFARNLLWQLGVGGGLTDSSDDIIVKSLLTYEFRTIRPSRQAR